MTGIRVREYHSEDLHDIVDLWQSVHGDTVVPVYSLAEVVASCQDDHAVVAVSADGVIGAAVARATHAQGWIVFLGSVRDAPIEVNAVLLGALETRMIALGLVKLSVLSTEGDDKLLGLESNGFATHHQLKYLERQLPIQRRELDLLQTVGGRMLPHGLWDQVSGMGAEKRLLEERLIMPLARPDFASRLGVVPPRAVMLFGPPGTGKTTFAKAVASRLDWPFVELFPSRMAASLTELPSALRETFDKIDHFEHVVVFIDEVEEVASRRQGDPPSPTQSVTNELLKLLAEFRGRDGRLLICATNFIRALDSAFLRHGRFDYVIPIGLPDEEARRAIWSRYIPAAALPQIDLDLLVSRSGGLTPADIEYAARRASQDALAQAVGSSTDSADIERLLITSRYIAALDATRATVSDDAAEQFRHDIDLLARL